MKATIISSKMIKKNTIPTTKLIDAQPAKRWTSRCLAVMLAISRSLRATGRIKVLTTSIKTRNGARAIGALRGRKCATSSLGPEKKVYKNLTSQKHAPHLRVKTLNVVRLITDGTNLKILATRIK